MLVRMQGINGNGFFPGEGSEKALVLGITCEGASQRRAPRYHRRQNRHYRYHEGNKGFEPLALARGAYMTISDLTSCQPREQFTQARAKRLFTLHLHLKPFLRDLMSLRRR